MFYVFLVQPSAVVMCYTDTHIKHTPKVRKYIYDRKTVQSTTVKPHATKKCVLTAVGGFCSSIKQRGANVSAFLCRSPW